MSKQVMIRAVKGMMVLDPATMLHLKEDGPGVEVGFSMYWRRRLKAGEIEIVEPKKVQKKVSNKKEKSKKMGDK